ncbi:transposase [Novosphingobium chloroacetimidivorans]|uniref:Transposase n=1 Tax=Novosphingobium chloroacetimidivorans TaxID=1428314 RepID=A0A7W7KFG4_9SPHN|nr:DUF1153 domain-containing protein [Novosphingobium chloroacetimidivorans]MBB4861108.1 transposase [Novosphingobium chloroacetimidivorans]
MALGEIETITEVVGFRGERLTLDKLPDRGTTRWVANRKAEVVAAVIGGLLTAREACNRYELSLEELVSWQRAIDRDGLPGLRATKAQQNRQKHERANRREIA